MKRTKCVITYPMSIYVRAEGGFGDHLMHLAAACGVPCVALYAGVEHPDVTGYPQNLNLCVDLDCAPCWRGDLCPTRECMDILTPEKIVAETINLTNSTVLKPPASQDPV